MTQASGRTTCCSRTLETGLAQIAVACAGAQACPEPFAQSNGMCAKQLCSVVRVYRTRAMDMLCATARQLKCKPGCHEGRQIIIYKVPI